MLSEILSAVESVVDAAGGLGLAAVMAVESVFPPIPSAFVEKKSARSRRTCRLSTTRVRPPVPGSTPSSGSSGSDTTDDRSSTSMMCSQASASS